MLEGIERHCRNLAGVESAIAEGATQTELETTIPPGGLEEYRAYQLGGLCGLLDTLEVTIIPKDRLDETIARLKRVAYKHVAIGNTIECLARRPR
jgi:hypothetical protein